MRGAGTALWVADHEWDTYVQYEAQITEALAGAPAMMLCTYKLSGARASDLADVAQFHQFSILLRKGRWELLETPAFAARQCAGPLNAAPEAPPEGFAGHERLMLGASAHARPDRRRRVEQAGGARACHGLRTIEFHRANIIQLNAGSVAERSRSLAKD